MTLTTKTVVVAPVVECIHGVETRACLQCAGVQIRPQPIWEATRVDCNGVPQVRVKVRLGVVDRFHDAIETLFISREHRSYGGSKRGRWQRSAGNLSIPAARVQGHAANGMALGMYLTADEVQHVAVALDQWREKHPAPIAKSEAAHV